MNGLTDTAIFILVFFAVIAGLIISFLAAKKQREELRNLAMQLWLNFTASDPFGIFMAYSFDCLNRGHSRHAENFIHGRLGNYDIKAFDYSYTTGNDKNKTTHYCSAVIMDTDVPLKPLAIRPENMFDRLAEMVGFDDIDFESEEFSRKFHVKSPDKKFAYDVIHPRMMEFLLKKSKWNIEILGRSVIIYNYKRFSVPEYKSAIDFANGFLGQFPDYLWKALRSS